MGDVPESPLGRLRSAIAATADLRADSGRLSARRVAEAFGLTLAQVAAAIGKARQTVWKTDDAVALQSRLFPFERIAGLRTLLSDTDFRSWLNMPNEHLDGRTPIEVIRSGQAVAVADLVEDVVIGSPA